jgi:1-acyl-sn-glycerol-3-phosphate acyltransferase
MDIRVEINGKSGENRVSLDRNYLILSNHLSYFDILILSSLFPAVFVSSVEMQKTFFLGDLAMLGGTVFVERRSSSGIKQEISRLAGVLKEGFSIVLFPEGTTSNGDRILPFKKSLMACAVEADIPVLPVCLKYQNLNGEAVNPENRDFIYWYGEMSFFPHFIRFLKQVNHLTVSLNLLEEIPVEKEEPSLARKKMASAAFHQIQQAYQS